MVSLPLCAAVRSFTGVLDPAASSSARAYSRPASGFIGRKRAALLRRNGSTLNARSTRHATSHARSIARIAQHAERRAHCAARSTQSAERTGKLRDLISTAHRLFARLRYLLH
eukprot:TRINITY_DN9537_c0_g1_i3.p4 TRINITY_DN9537_c0_g1~~TRINITY_DN9537_c0_g1_i3.p4  ORF type:complete len:113 (-),score=9.44 TRINITY_DN9537_c0_g1_i3:63-401(-)